MKEWEYAVLKFEQNVEDDLSGKSFFWLINDLTVVMLLQN